MKMSKKVGFIGLGIMGMPMAKNLLNAGNTMCVYDINPAANKEMQDIGAAVAETPRDVAAASDFVMTMLPDAPDVEKVYLGKDGIIEGAHEGLIMIDTSTTDAASTIKVAEILSKVGIRMIDAPVMGIQPNAEQGTLIMNVGGSDEDVAACKDLLDIVGARTVHAGPLGAGKNLKLINNLMQGTLLCYVAEAIALVRRSGIDIEIFMELFKGNLLRNFEFGAFKMLQNNFDPLFKTHLMLKDMRLGHGTAIKLGASVPLASMAREMLQVAVNSGLADNDCTSVFKVYDEKEQ
jgi:2-hydroxy-3-oxopropionate reductase